MEQLFKILIICFCLLLGSCDNEHEKEGKEINISTLNEVAENDTFNIQLAKYRIENGKIICLGKGISMEINRRTSEEGSFINFNVLDNEKLISSYRDSLGNCMMDIMIGVKKESIFSFYNHFTSGFIACYNIDCISSVIPHRQKIIIFLRGRKIIVDGYDEEPGSRTHDSYICEGNTDINTNKIINCNMLDSIPLNLKNKVMNLWNKMALKNGDEDLMQFN